MHLKTVAGAAQRSRDDLHNKLSEVNMELELVNQRNNFLDKQVHPPMAGRHLLVLSISGEFIFL